MRDPNRIPRICDDLKAAWERHPDMRLGQLLVNAIQPGVPCSQIFYAEDLRTQRGLVRLSVQSPEPPPGPLEAAVSWAPIPAPAPTTATLIGAETGGFEVPEGPAEILRVRFGGVYRDGSAGKPDQAFMRARLAELLASEWPDAVLLDLSRMTYRWGDGIIGLLQYIAAADLEEPIGAVVLGGPDSIGGLRSLLGGRAFDDEAAAIAEAAGIAARRCRDIG